VRLGEGLLKTILSNCPSESNPTRLFFGQNLLDLLDLKRCKFEYEYVRYVYSITSL
jgi:hypothetical protein